MLKLCPWIVTVDPTAPCTGVKLKIASALAEESVDVVMDSMFPIAS